MQNLANFITDNYIAVFFFLGFGAVALFLGLKRRFRDLLILGGIAVLVGLFIFFPQQLFGKNGNITGAAKDAVGHFNTVSIENTTFAPGFLE